RNQRNEARDSRPDLLGVALQGQDIALPLRGRMAATEIVRPEREDQHIGSVLLEETVQVKARVKGLASERVRDGVPLRIEELASRHPAPRAVVELPRRREMELLGPHRRAFRARVAVAEDVEVARPGRY